MSKISIRKRQFRWLFGGVGFHNSEASMTPIMSEKLKNQVILKSFREIAPTFSRVYAGFADWTKEAMDTFADYYDETFRSAGTLLYIVPGRMPYITDDFDMEEYSEKVAKNLDYLIKERKCTKVRYYCATNELSVGNTYAWFANHLDLFQQLHECLYKAFKRHNLDISLMATDCSGVENFGQIEWATSRNNTMDEITGCYCVHLYSAKYLPGDMNAYNYFIESLSPPVLQAQSREKRLVLGEFGITPKRHLTRIMSNDVSWNEENPEISNIYAISLCEMAMASINCGCFACANWTFIDYPDPFIREDGDAKEEKSRYMVACFSGHGTEIRYNKNGLIKWCDEEEDYSSKASLYTMGYMAKLFKKGSRVLESSWDDESLRCCAVTNPDSSASIVIINWDKSEKAITIELEHISDKPYRKYEYRADNVPYNKFNDLQSAIGTVAFNQGETEVILSPQSVTFLTTDYTDRTPSKIHNIKFSDGILTWDKCQDKEHCYYRVFASDKKDFVPNYENQIASTVAEYLQVDKPQKYYKVLSVDNSGNV